MGLDFYATFEALSIDSKNNLVIKLKAPAEKVHDQLNLLSAIKSDHVVSLSITSAMMSFERQVDSGSGELRKSYHRNGNNKWVEIDNGQTTLDLGNEPSYINQSVKITADVVDDFILSQRADYPNASFDPKHVLNRVAEGYSIDEIASDLGLTPLSLIDALNEARQYFAPYAVAWVDEQNGKN